MPHRVSRDARQNTVARAGGRFATTQWSVVLQAGGTQGSRSRQALERLCRTYWYPLYAFIRRRGASPPEAQDLTQGFFMHLLEGGLVTKADPEKGKFRSFLLVSFKYYISNEEARACAQKRGGRGGSFAFDAAAGESRFSHEPMTQAAPEWLFERSWATKVLEQALDRLRQEFTKAGRADAFQELRPMLEGEKAEGGYDALARKLGVVEGTIKWMVHRMRARYRELIHAVIADTVGSPAEVEEEVQHLITVLRT